MQQTILNELVNSLRLYVTEHYDVKLKPTHAHELMAAMCGYRSKNALLADTEHSMDNLESAELIVFNPDELLNTRRKSLKELPAELPDSNVLSDTVFNSFSSNDELMNYYPPFRSFDTLAKYLIKNNDAYKSTFMFYKDIPMEHIVNIRDKEDIEKNDSVSLLVFHAYETYDGQKLVAGQTSITLPRVAGHIGYGHPVINVTIFTGGMKRDLETMGAQLC